MNSNVYGSLASTTLDNFKIATIGSDLYALVTSKTGNNYVPYLFKSTSGGKSWTQDTAPSFGSIIGYSLVSDDSSLYLIGGLTSDATVTDVKKFTYNDDVWKFTPGTSSWAKVASAPFVEGTTSLGGKTGVAVAYDASTGKLYVYGGASYSSSSGALIAHNDVYESTTTGGLGVNWTRKNGNALPPYALRYHCMVANNGVLYSLGGYGFANSTETTASYKTVVQKSTDAGATWSVVNSTYPTQPRGTACSQINNTLYITGGRNADYISGGVRRSLDGGVTWALDPYTSVHGFRNHHSMTVLNNKLYILGGLGVTGTNAQTATEASLTDLIVGTP